MKENYKKGFTLIELLVVIAIIGILSSVILVSLNTARVKGKSGRVQAEAAQIRTQLEANYTGSLYPDLSTAAAPPGADLMTAGTWAAGGALNLLSTDITTGQGGLLKVYDSGTAAANVTGYAVYVAYPGSSGGYCVDSTGNTKTSFTGVAAFTAASNFATCAASTGL